MPNLTDAELVKAIRAKKYYPCYFFWGKDAATCESYAKKLADRLVPPEARDLNYHFFNSRSFSLSELADICESLPAFTDRVVALINDLNAESLRLDEQKQLFDIISKIYGETTSVIFYATGVDLAAGKKALSPKNKKLADHISKCGGAVVEFAYKRPNELVKHIQSRLGKSGCFMSPENAEYLAAIQGCSLLMINNECDKLTSYMGSGEIGRGVIDLLVSGEMDTDAYKLSKALISGKSSEVFGILDSLFNKQSEAIPILSVISGSMMDLYRAKTAILAGRSENDVSSDFNYKGRDFVVRNAFRDCRSMPIEKLRYSLKILSDCDISLKSKRTDQRIMLEEAITKILSYSNKRSV